MDAVRARERRGRMRPIYDRQKGGREDEEAKSVRFDTVKKTYLGTPPSRSGRLAFTPCRRGHINTCPRVRGYTSRNAMTWGVDRTTKAGGSSLWGSRWEADLGLVRREGEIGG